MDTAMNDTPGAPPNDQNSPMATVVNEVQRTYMYADSKENLTFDHVIDIRISKSGNHYLRYRPLAGMPDYIYLAIVAPGWRAITISPGPEAKGNWSF